MKSNDIKILSKEENPVYKASKELFEIESAKLKYLRDEKGRFVKRK